MPFSPCHATFVVFACTLFGSCAAQEVGYENPACDGRKVIVHLFEWKWTDVALECERFLAYTGFCGVQVSPPNEHAVITEEYPYPWWQRYQPISYKLGSRSGTEEEFIDMVHQCNAVGVRIFVDAIVNHMAGLGRNGTGSAGSSFDSDARDFPGVPYSAEHFTPRDMCPSDSGMVDNYSDPDNVRNCYLVGLTDLYGATEYVRKMVAEYFSKLVDIGVAGFRVDAAKHMWPEDLQAMMDLTHDLNPDQGFPAGTRPFFSLEVIDRNDGAVTVQEYYGMGRPTEFRYCQKIAWGIQDFNLLYGVYDPGWFMADSDKAFVFVDNHDNQRGHGGAGDTLTYKWPHDYRLGVAFTLAQPYGYTRIMSSYYFDDDTDAGPPHNTDYSTADVIIDSENQCDGGWVCEHRWDSIYKMVRFRNAVSPSDWWDNYYCDGNVVAFSRGDKGFFTMVKYGTVSQTFQTSMPAGTYEDIVSCQSVTVNEDGTVQVSITNEDEPVFAICQGCDCSEPPVVTTTPEPITDVTTTVVPTTTQGPTEPPTTTQGPTEPPTTTQGPTEPPTTTQGPTEPPTTTQGPTEPPTTTQGPTEPPTTTQGPTEPPTTTQGPTEPPIIVGIHRTVVFIHKQTIPEQDLFIRGGIDAGERWGCTDITATDPCAIDMETNSLGETTHYDKYNSWRLGDTRLDWQGAEPSQGTYQGQTASGSPLAWTSNQPGDPGYQELNEWGEHYWMIDTDMNCTQAEDGWFEVKSFLTNSEAGWEGDISQIAECAGTAGGSAPYTSVNHLGRCGFVNMFTFDSAECMVNNFPGEYI